MMRRFIRFVLLVSTLFSIGIIVTALDEDIDPAPIVNDEGGAVLVTGQMVYTNAFFTSLAVDGFVYLEDQTGFVNRDLDYVLPLESQIIAQITSNIFISPFTYSLQLPIEPQAPLNDVDHDNEADVGVQIFQVSFTTNVFGDIYIEERDGTGWSGGYSSAVTETEPPDRFAEYVGGKVLIYAPVHGQAFPSGFGDDAALFTDDDPLVIVPQGWTVVNMDTDPFTFDRSREPVIDMLEAETSALDDFSEMSYTDAFDAMMEKMRIEYSYTEFAGIDWDAIDEEFRPRFVEAEANNDAEAYYYAIFDFTVAIGDRHTNSNILNFLNPDFVEETTGGIGIAIRELSDGRVIVNYLGEDTPADDAGIELGAEILEIDGVPIMEAVNNTRAWSEPFNTEHVRTLQRLRYVVRFPVGTDLELTYANPGEEEETVSLTAVEEPDSFSYSSFTRGLSATRLPVEWEIIDNMMLVEITSFIDSLNLTLRLWERMLNDARAQNVEGIIIDMRSNQGGFGTVADAIAAYFFDEEFVLGNNALYNEHIDGFYFGEEGEETFELPPDALRYRGPVAVLIGPFCFSACEFFAHNMSINDRAFIVGQYPTIGGGGSTEVFLMPDGVTMQMTVGRSIDADGNIHIQNQGVAPTVLVPVDEDTLGLTDVTYINDDPILDTAIQTIRETNNEAISRRDIVDAGEIEYDAEVSGEIEIDQRIQYTFALRGDEPVNIYVDSDLDTVLRIYDETGENLIVENDDLDGYGLRSGFEDIANPQDITLIIEVATFNDEGQGEYTLIVTTGDNPLEPETDE